MSSKVKGDPLGESTVLVELQRALNGVPGVLPAARAMSFFGEHALGWMGLAALGCAVDERRRVDWAKVGVAAFTSHAASVVLKRIVRRPRPHDPRIKIGVGTPSKLSFPSSHATSTTAALVGIAKLTSSPAPLAGVPAIMLSRLVLGVHYPTDVSVGAALGAGTAIVVDKLGDRLIEPKTAQPNRGASPISAERNAQ